MTAPSGRVPAQIDAIVEAVQATGCVVIARGISPHDTGTQINVWHCGEPMPMAFNVAHDVDPLVTGNIAYQFAAHWPAHARGG